MYSPELLKKLVVTIQAIQKILDGTDLATIDITKQAYQELLDDFYENGGVVVNEEITLT